ncbi:capsid assembly protein [Pseudoduganella lutea]|uniref:Capsid assembly protein n=1 Tax=Pseudoduganella lutea TaxID=321985 RepID=A0A4V0Z4G3_9BURK|nr:capsid assembly protein [Pseudoduganella lutea]QBE66843.1 capsid assembly protein [Pseudoduganella lutea]
MTEQVTIKQPAPAEDQAHVAAMVAKVDGTPTPEDPAAAPSGDRPAWLPEKFKTPEEMAAAFAELEGKQASPAEKAPEVPPVPEGGTEQVSQELADKGLNLEDFSTEFAQKGELSAESYEKLTKAGYPKALVDQYIEGQKVLGERYQADVMSAAGGAEQFAEVADWAANNLTPAEIAAYNEAVDSRDPVKAKLAVTGITAKYREANPTEGNLIGGSTKVGAGDSYESLAQMTADMATPQYKTDPAFRKKVQEKIGRSSII